MGDDVWARARVLGDRHGPGGVSALVRFLLARELDAQDELDRVAAARSGLAVEVVKRMPVDVVVSLGDGCGVSS